nr:MAG TPA: hypothetical protein [Caudoviricetes sp.]
MHDKIHRFLNRYIGFGFDRFISFVFAIESFLDFSFFFNFSKHNYHSPS